MTTMPWGHRAEDWTHTDLGFEASVLAERGIPFEGQRFQFRGLLVEVLFVAGRIGIAWGGDAAWEDADSLEAGVAAWEADLAADQAMADYRMAALNTALNAVYGVL